MKKMASIGYRLTRLLVLLALSLSVVSCAGNSLQPSSLQPASPVAKLATDTQQSDLIFAVAGDSRAGVSGQSDFWIDPSKQPDYTNYINTQVLGALRDNLITTWKDSPGFFLMHLGDIGMRGGTPIFEAFKQEMSPMKNAGIPVYLTIGNHELRYYKPKENGSGTGKAESDANTLKAQQEYQATIGTSMIPSDANSLQFYEGGLAYSFKREVGGVSSLFIVLDAYYVNYDDPKKPEYKKGYYSDFQLKWLQDTLKNNQNAQNIFVFSHQPAFDANGGAGKLYNNYNSPDSDRSNWILWALLDTYKVDAYFTGHSHFYHRWNVIGNTFEYKWKDTWRALDSNFTTLGELKDHKEYTYLIPQVVNGSCGASLQGFAGNSVPAAKRENAYNYSIVQVKGSTITVEVYSYDVTTQPKLIDKFQKQGDQWQTLPLN